MGEDNDLVSIYLHCSSRGVNCLKRGTDKTQCQFKVRLSKTVTGDFHYIASDLNHNHPGPLVTTRADGKVEMKIFQRHLQDEEETRIHQEPSFERQQTRLVSEFARRYLALFEAMGDDEASEYFQKVYISIYSIFL